MGTYWIPCKQCGKVFMWWSGCFDQRCAECKEADVKIIKAPTSPSNEVIS